MTLSLDLETINDLPRTAASDVKKLGWRGVMKAVDRAGKVVVTHHDEPQAVILSTAAYHEILQALQQARFDEPPRPVAATSMVGGHRGRKGTPASACA